MKYPVSITKENMHNYSLSVVDLPGCKVKAETVDEGLTKLKKVVGDHLEILAEYGEAVPNAQLIDYHLKQNENVIWAIIEIDIVPYLGKSQKINVTLPELLIKKIDDRVSKSPEHKTRSGFIASVCLNELSKEI
ncbi:type II toxin-antitoxin system HicB family antitoxin [Colwellia sp. UCD-KL20]|uniref:type II toxin-antitoxin system HicB family antitoxin n=1 Tax=Colwellia sp. UCD-KL20 TaxID=1917165 RepID=UPI0009711F61|nr:type II toxin-antitoxin system HicB family antitoxin [Colwellia sp. UCD-KL20]